MISDLLWPANPSHAVRKLHAGGAALFIVQLLAREDAEPPVYGSVRLVDSETGETSGIFVDAAVARLYRDYLARWQQAWADTARQCGALMTTLIAEDMPDSVVALQTMQLLAPA